MKKPGLGAVLRDAWRLASPYYRSEQRWSARLLLVAIIAMNLAGVGVDVLLNFWRGQMYDTLQNKDAGGFFHLVFLWRWNENGFMPGFVPIVALAIPIAVYAYYLTQLLQIRWRAWMNDRFLHQWLSDRAYYTIALQHVPGLDESSRTDNPDQRIAEDLQKFTDDTLRLGIDLLSTVVSLASFAQILWTLSGTIELLGVPIPGYMLFIAILYAIAGTMLTHYVGRPLAQIEFERQKVEADYRFGLIRVRENAEGIALYDGHRSEEAGLLVRFAAVVRNWRRLMTRRKRLNTLRQGYAQVAAVFPIVIAAPRYFAGGITLGGLMQVAGAFSQVQSSLSWFVDNYPSLAAWRATVDRLTGFQHALANAHALAGRGVQVQTGQAGGIALHGLDLALPDGRTLLSGDVAFPAGQSTVVSGRSGLGKSTLFRALAGIWPFGRGTVDRPPGTHLFLPQRPYIPLGTLREAVTYPSTPGSVPDAAIHQALTDAGLGTLISELDVDQTWGQRLSGGEQQRLAVARALLQRPDWLYLDEATASLDPEAEAELYEILRRRLPETTIISIAHRPDVAKWHDQAVVLRDGTLAPAG